MAQTNQYLKVELNAARSSLKNFRDAKFALVTKKHGLGDIAMLRSWLQAYYNNYNLAEADATLPQDNPDTVENEEKTRDDVQTEAEYFLKTDFNTILTANGEEAYKQYLQEVTAKVREIVGQQYQLETEINAAQSKVNDLVALQQSESEANKTNA